MRYLGTKTGQRDGREAGARQALPGLPSEAADARVLAGYGLGSGVANGRAFAGSGRHVLARSCRLVERAMDYDQIDVLDKGTVWQGGALDAAIDSPPFAGPLLVVCMDRGEDNDQFINHATVEAVLAVWIDDAPTGCLKDGVLTGLADAIVAWLNDGGNVYLHCREGRSRASYIDIAIHCRALGISADDALTRIRAHRPIADPNPGFLAQLQRLWP